MFGFKKKTEERQEPDFDVVAGSQPQEQKNLADILGAEANDTNITAAVDALLDDDGEIGDSRDELAQESFSVPSLDGQQSEDEQAPQSDTLNDEEYEYEYEYVEDDGQGTEEAYEYDEADPTDNDISFAAKNDEVEVADETFEEGSDVENGAPEAEISSQETESVLSDLKDVVENGSSDQFLDDILNIGEETTESNEDTLEIGNISEEDESVVMSEETLNTLQEHVQALTEKVSQSVSDEKELTQSMEATPAEIGAVQPKEEPVQQEEEPVQTEPDIQNIIVPVAPAHISDGDLYHISEVAADDEKVKLIDKNSGTCAWQGDKYQQDIRLVCDNDAELGQWTLMVIKHFSVPLQSQSSEVVIDKGDNVFRYATLMSKGEEKLKIYNQETYKFVMPQNSFFTVQGNVIFGAVDDTFSLNITDYVTLSLVDKADKALAFDKPASGFIFGPNGVKMSFANLRTLFVSVRDKSVREDFFEYIPSLDGFDSKEYFVYDETQGDKEFIAHGKQKYLVVNIGQSLYGWNVRFDNEMYMSLRDALEYQSRYKKLPSANGEIIHGANVFKFFGIEKLKAREKTVYYSYGKI